MHFDRRNAFQDVLIFFLNYVCIPYLKCSDPLPDTLIF